MLQGDGSKRVPRPGNVVDSRSRGCHRLSPPSSHRCPSICEFPGDGPLLLWAAARSACPGAELRELLVTPRRAFLANTAAPTPATPALRGSPCLGLRGSFSPSSTCSQDAPAFGMRAVGHEVSVLSTKTTTSSRQLRGARSADRSGGSGFGLVVGSAALALGAGSLQRDQRHAMGGEVRHSILKPQLRGFCWKAREDQECHLGPCCDRGSAGGMASGRAGALGFAVLS